LTVVAVVLKIDRQQVETDTAHPSLPFSISIGVAMTRTLGATFLCALLLSYGQTPGFGQATNEGPEGTLPPVVVQPPAQSAEQDGGTEPAPPGGDFPSISAAPSPSPTPSAGIAVDFPSLSDLRLGAPGPFGENTGVLRGAQSLFDTPAAASIRSREEIRERQSADMFQALQNEVGVLLQSTAAGQASPFIRGLTGQQVLILVDGIRLNNSIFRQGPNQYFNTIDPGMIDHVEVLRGQGSVLWGSDAIGGTINIVTRSADAHRGTCHSEYLTPEFTQYYNTSNDSPYSRFNVEGWTGRSGVFAGGSFLNVRDLNTGFDEFSRQPGTNYQQWAGDMKFNYLLDTTRLLTVSLQHLEQEDVARSDRFPGYPLDRNHSNTPAGTRFFDPQQRDLAYIRYQALEPWEGTFDAATFTASYHRQREVQTRGIPTMGSQETDVDTTGLQLAISRDLDVFGKWITGVDWYHDDVDSPFAGSAGGPIIPDDAWYRRVGWFLLWDVPLTDRLSAAAGWRYESIETAGTPIVMNTPVNVNPSYDDWLGQVGLTYELNPCLCLVGSIAEGFRAPNLDDLMANNPNVLQEGQSLPSLGLTPEHSVNYEVGAKANFDRLRLQTFVYWIDLQDNIVSIAAAPDTFASANQDSIIQGVESSGEWLLQQRWALYGNFWYTFGENRITQAPLSRIPPTQGILGLRYRPPGGRAYSSLYTWMSDRQDRLDPVRDVTDERIPIGGTPGFATLNLRAGRSLGRRDEHRVSLSLENITDQPYLVHGSGVLGTGFTARLGYNWVY
jgi:outer membrane receptor protein involved in Fe transport